jgi:hypothetical protein
MRIAVIFSFLSLMALAAFGQNSETTQPADQRTKGKSNSLEPYYPKENKVPKKAKKKPSTKGATYESEQQYYERMAKVFKDKEKAEKEMAKPQYSNPMYFGHKRPPKKHKPGKMKFCKECGMRH